MEETKLSRCHIRRNHIISGDISDSLFLPIHGVVLRTDARPAQINLCTRIDHSRAHRKRIDTADSPIARKISEIAELLRIAHRCRQRSHQELCLIDTRIIRINRSVGNIYGTVEETDGWMIQRRLHTGECHLWHCCKDYVASLFHCLLDRLIDLFLSLRILKNRRLESSIETLLKVHASELL